MTEILPFTCDFMVFRGPQKKVLGSALPSRNALRHASSPRLAGPVREPPSARRWTPSGHLRRRSGRTS